ncbi:hypothetical protein JXQ70_00930 [bacterium]|nr:hypothetical protein [bacterium]
MFHSNKAVLAMVLMCCFCALIIIPQLEAKNDLNYDKKLFRHLQKKDIEQIPANEDYPGADAIIIYDETIKEQYFGYYSLWDITYKELGYKVWKVVNPSVERLQKVVIELSNNKEVDEFEINLYPFQGESQRFKKENLQVQTYTYPEGGSEYKKAVLELPAMASNCVIEMEYILNVRKPLFWEKFLIQGLDPIVQFHYGFRTPEFVKMSPTQLYAPVAHNNPFLYKFRAFDAVNKKLVEPKQKNGFFFSFEKLPSISEADGMLPKANKSSFLAFCVNDLIIKDPVDSRYDEKYEAYMQISPDTPQNFISSAGSPAAYRIPFHDWACVSDYLYFDLFDDILKSKVFEEVAATIIGDLSEDVRKNQTLLIQKAYNFLSKDFVIDDFRPAEVYALTIKDIERALTNRKAHQFDLGFIFWGLLQHVGIEAKLGVGFTHDAFLGEFDRKFPIPIQFNTSLVVVGQKEKAQLYYPGESTLRMGSYPPEIEGADFLIISLRDKAVLAEENLYLTDKLNPYINVRQNSRVTAEWQLLQVGSPTANKTSSKFELTVAEDGTIVTKAVTTFCGHEETLIRRALQGLDQQAAEQFARDWYTKQLENAEISSVSLKHVNDFAANVEFDAEFSLPFAVKDNTLAIPFSFFNQTKVLPITEKQAEELGHEVVFPFMSFVWNDFMVTFDKGWKIQSGAQSTNFQKPEGMVATNIRQTENQFNYQRGFTMTSIYLKDQQIQELLGYFAKIKELEKADILVLEKI